MRMKRLHIYISICIYTYLYVYIEENEVLERSPLTLGLLPNCLTYQKRGLILLYKDSKFSFGGLPYSKGSVSSSYVQSHELDKCFPW
jgi:hypothetical protein